MIMWNSFGEIFKMTTFGESHCKGVGAIIDGCPAGIPLTEADIQKQLDRRRPGQSDLSTPRQESDTVTILSGTENGITLGTPIAVSVPNKDQRPGDYAEMSQVPRPSHADYTYLMKYGVKSSSGGGRASARETIGRVAAGAIAEKVLIQWHGIEIVSWVSGVGHLSSHDVNMHTVNRKEVDADILRCPDVGQAALMKRLIEEVRDQKDSVGGVVSCVIRNLPAGIGDPVFGKLEARLAHAMLSIPATKGFEFGSGFAGSTMRGSEHNDPFVWKGDRLGTATNFSGGIQGGISNGEPIYFRVAFKPVATIGKEQKTVDLAGKETILAAKGRHDPCVVPRAVPIVEAMAAVTVLDALLLQRAYR